MRDRKLSLRLNELEWAHLEKCAKESDRTVASYVRWKLFRVVEPYLSPEPGFVEVAREIASEEKEAAPVKVEKKQKVCPRCVRINAGKPLSGCRACLSGGS